MRRREDGYTLLELLIALGLSMAVMMGIFSVLSSMIRFQVEGARRTTVDSWAIASVVAMNKEIESADVLVAPANPDGTAADYLKVCTNWSNVRNGPATGGKMDPTQPVTIYSYCYDPTAPGVLRRNMVTGSATCPGGFNASVCTAANYGPSSTVATSVSRLGAAKFFTRENTINGVRLQYQVGVSNVGPLQTVSGPQMVNPQYLQFDTRVTLQRAYGTTAD